jgi:hypothetical protein
MPPVQSTEYRDSKPDPPREQEREGGGALKSNATTSAKAASPKLPDCRAGRIKRCRFLSECKRSEDHELGFHRRDAAHPI